MTKYSSSLPFSNIYLHENVRSTLRSGSFGHFYIPNASAHLGRRHDWVYSLVRVTDNIEVITLKIYFMAILAITAKEKHRVL